MKQNYKFETLAAPRRSGAPGPGDGHELVPIYATTSYVFRDSARPLAASA